MNALLGTVNALLAAIEARPPRAVVACLGAEEAAYRVALYPGYHAHRDPDARGARRAVGAGAGAARGARLDGARRATSSRPTT